MAVGDGFGLGVVLEAKDLFSGTMRNAASAFKDVEGATSSAGQKINDNLKMLGTGMAIFGAGMGGLAALAAPTKAFGEFAAGISEITTLSDEASLSTLNLGEMVLKMNGAYGGGAAAQTKALYDGISAGAANAAEANALLDASNKLGVAGRAEVGVSLDGLTSSINAYNDSMGNATAYSDAMFVAVQKGKTTIPELAAVVGRVAPLASAMGISFDEVSAALAAITAKGLKTDEATTGLKAVMQSIIQPTASAAAEAAKLGIKFDQTTLRSVGLKGILNSITGSAKFSATSLSQLFPPAEALNSVFGLTANKGAKFNEALLAMEGKAGATDKAFEKMAATTEFQGKRFDGLSENAMILIGSVLDPMKARVMALGNAFLEAFNNLPDGVREWLVKGFALASTLLTIVGGALMLKAGIGVLAAGFNAAGITAATFATTLAPIVLTLAAIGLAVYAFRTAWEHNVGGIATTITRGVDQVKLVFGAFGQLMEDGGISGSIRDDLNKAENGGLKNFVKTVWLFANRVQAAWEGVSSGFSKAMDTAGPAITAFGTALDKAFGNLGGLGDKIDPGDARSKFERWAATGEKIGKALGEVVIKGVELGTWAIDMGTKAKGLVDDLGGVGRILDVLKIALVVIVASKAAGFLSSMGSAGIEAALGIGKAAAASKLFSAGQLATGAPGIVSAFKNISSAAGAALGPIAAATAAIAALYLAYDQWTKLKKELGESGWSDIGTKLKHDLGMTSDSTYSTQMGLVTGDEYDQQVKSGEIKNGLNGHPGIVPPAASFSPAAESGPANTADAAAMYAPIVDAIAAGNAKQQQSPVKAGPTYVSVKLDSRDIRASMSAGERSDADASGAPGMAVMD